jgi:hypothetical protein
MLGGPCSAGSRGAAGEAHMQIASPVCDSVACTQCSETRQKRLLDERSWFHILALVGQGCSIYKQSVATELRSL